MKPRVARAPIVKDGDGGLEKKLLQPVYLQPPWELHNSAGPKDLEPNRRRLSSRSVGPAESGNPHFD